MYDNDQKMALLTRLSLWDQEVVEAVLRILISEELSNYHRLLEIKRVHCRFLSGRTRVSLFSVLSASFSSTSDLVSLPFPLSVPYYLHPSQPHYPRACYSPFTSLSNVGFRRSRTISSRSPRNRRVVKPRSTSFASYYSFRGTITLQKPSR